MYATPRGMSKTNSNHTPSNKPHLPMDEVQNLLRSARSTDRFQKVKPDLAVAQKSAAKSHRPMVAIPVVLRRALSRVNVRPTDDEKQQIASTQVARSAELARIRKQRDDRRKEKMSRNRGSQRP